MADGKNPHVEVLELQAALAQLQAQLLGTQAELARYKHQELLAAMGRTQQALAVAKTEPEAVTASVRQQLIEIAGLPIERLTSFVTKQAQNDDGTPKLGPDGKVILLHQDGTPLSITERAMIARLEELRAASGG